MFRWLRENRAKKMRVSIEEALLAQACASLRDGSRFQFRVEAIDGDQNLKRFIVKLSMMIGYNVWANCGHGLVTVYSHDTDSSNVVIATIKGM